MSISQQLPIEEGKSQSPESTNRNENLIHKCRRNQPKSSFIGMKKHRRRAPMMFMTKMKLVVMVLSVLYIGDNRSNPNWAQTKKQATSFGAVFVVGAATDEQDTEKRKPRMMRAHAGAAPNVDVPVLQKKKNNIATSSMKSLNFVSMKEGKRQDIESKEEIASVTFSEILKKAGKSGIGGGIPGAIAGVVQVLSLMWLRTIVNYQCRYGSSFLQSIRALNNQGGIPRFYSGVSFALIQAPLARFASTAANDGVETLLANLKWTKSWGAGRSTVIASIVVGFWRIFLMPIDTCKTVLQIDSVDGFRSLMRKVKAGKIYVLYQGATANAISAIFSHYPWFYTFRVLSNNTSLQKLIGSNHIRNALIGFTSSVVSDSFTNSIRVVKTAKQAIASKQAVSYGEVIAMILAVDGLKGLFGRGLRTRIFGNALQSVLFTVIWRGLAERKNQTREQPLQSSREDTPNEVATEGIQEKDASS